MEVKIIKEIEDSRIALMTELENIKQMLEKQNFNFEAFKDSVMKKLE